MAIQKIDLGTLSNQQAIKADTGNILSGLGDVASTVGTAANQQAIKSDTEGILSGIGDMASTVGTAANQQAIKADTGSIKADTGSILTDTGSIKSDTGSILTDTGSIKADTGSILTDTGSIKADTGSILTDTGSIKADTGSIKTDLGGMASTVGTLSNQQAIKADTGSIKSDTGSILTDTGIIKTDLGNMASTVGTLSNQQAIKADTGSILTDTGSIKADAAIIKTDLGNMASTVGTLSNQQAIKADTENVLSGLGNMASTVGTSANQQAIKSDTENILSGLGNMSSTVGTAANQQSIKSDTESILSGLGDMASTVGTAANQQAIKADVEALKIIMAGSRVCQLTVNLNPTGGAYDVPTDPTELAEILNGAQLVVNEQGIETPYRYQLSALENVSWTQSLYVTDASLYAFSKAGAVLGKSATCSYAVATAQFKLEVNGNVTVNLYTVKTSVSAPDVVEYARIQPYSATSSGNITIGSVTYADDGRSFIGVRTTNGSGTTWRTGGFAFNSSTQWIDASLVKVPVYDVADANSTPVEYLISDGGSAANATDIMQTLACLRNIRMADVTLTSGNTSIAGNKFIVFDQVWVKTTKENVPINVYDAQGNVTGTVSVPCICKWFCDAQADAAYHLSPIHVQYRRQGDGSFVEVPMELGFVARYYSNVQNVTIDGTSTPVMNATSDGSKEIGATRSAFLGRARAMNRMAVTVAIEGEGSPRSFAANSDNRMFSMAGLAEDSFIGMMAYLFFGANVQASLPGICTNAVSSTTNGATDYILAKGVWTGAKDHASTTNSIVFLGIEDANWSSTGCMLPDITAISSRTITTDAQGSATSNVTDSYFIYALDRLDYLPGDSTANYNLTTTDPATGDTITSPAWFLDHGYRRTAFAKATSTAYLRRIGFDDSALIRDAFIFTTDTGDENVNMAGCDYSWNVGFPSTPGTLTPSSTTELYNWLMVARGNGRSNGSTLGIASLNAVYALSYSSGSGWRSRPSLQLSPA